MTIDSDKQMHSRKAQLDADTGSLRDRYMTVNKPYTQTLDAQKQLNKLFPPLVHPTSMP